jgi:PAS domain S-box-containing protein
MRFFQNTSIRRKQTLIIMLTSMVVLLLACAAFVTYDVARFRREMVESTSSLAEVVGNTTTAAIDFNDPSTAAQTLTALRGEPNIVLAHIHTLDGKVFATYLRAGAQPPPEIPLSLKPRHEFTAHQLHLFRPIVQGAEQVGTIELVASLDVLHDRLWRYVGIVVIVFGVALLAAFGLSSRLQKLISDPILHLAQTARLVAQEKNYSLRARKQSNDELGQLMDGFNEMLGQIQDRDAALQAARDHLERSVEERTKELAESQSLYHSLVDQMPAGVFRKDTEGRYVFVNSWYCQIKGITAEQILGKSPRELASWELANQNVTQPETTRENRLAIQGSSHHELIIATGKPIEVEEEYPGVDGKMQYLHVVKLPVFDFAGRIIGTQGMLFDVTKRKEAETELENTHKQLLDASRRGGMAEIATNVLHNVGNVLNSVNVSTGLIIESVKKSRVSSLARVVALLREHAHELGTFMTHEVRGKQLPDYLAQLSEHLLAEQAAMVRELNSLRGNVEHIKEIVAMQQGYATFGGVKEMIDVVHLVEDSLRMSAGALSRHRIELIREFEKVPLINVEKHKILQILVNLLRNAKHACQDATTAGRQMTVRVANGAGRIRISVIDNGVGVPAENLIRIFNHGFTTRKDGHGFGLHSGALAAKEMGGSLTVQSDGPGKGAAFTLELPSEPSPPKPSDGERSSAA